MSMSSRPAARKLRIPEAAQHLGVSPEMLKKLRRSKRGPVFIRIGRTIVYDLHDLEDFAAAHRSQPGARPRPSLI